MGAIESRPRQTAVSNYLVLLITSITILSSLFLSKNPIEMTASILCIGVSFFIVGGDRAPSVLLLIITMIWLPIALDILIPNVDEAAIISVNDASSVLAIWLSLLAVIVIAFGISVGWGRRHVLADVRTEHISFSRMPLNSAVLLYVSFLMLATLFQFLGNIFTTIAQPLYVLGFIRYVGLFILAARIFSVGRGLWLLAFALGFETFAGITGYIASFQAPYLIVIVAGLTSWKSKLSLAQAVGIVAGFLSLLWLAVIWTAIKPDFREWGSGGVYAQVLVKSPMESAQWILDRVTEKPVDYPAAFVALIKRFGYTSFYGEMIARLEVGAVPPTTLWLDSLENIVKPRFLFPNKESLNDTRITALLTGRIFDDVTSVSIGYVAEAHADFGLPWMYIPLFLVGAIIGRAVRFLMQSDAPLLLRQAVSSGFLYSSFQYGANVDKASSSFILSFLVASLILRTAYPRMRLVLNKRIGA